MLTVLFVKVPRESENSPEQTAQLLASLSRATKLNSRFKKLFGRKDVFLALEITLFDSQIIFSVVCPPNLKTFVESQLLATYPDAIIHEVPDYLLAWPKNNFLAHVKQTAKAYFPLRDYADYKEVDPLSPMLGVLAKLGPADRALIQFVLTPAHKNVTSAAQTYIVPRFEDSPEGKSVRELPPEEKQIIKDKLSHPLAGVYIRFAASSQNIVTDLLGAISVLNRPDGNSLAAAKIRWFEANKLWQAILSRTPFRPWSASVATLNVMELSSLWHLPGVQTKLPNIAWAVSVATSEAPENLPISVEGGTNQDLNFFAQVRYKNETKKFGIKLADRLRHMYVLGKTGTGKSTLLENMAVDDFKKGRGIAFIDPHGDSVQNLLNYIPKDRINDTIYFNPSDREHPIAINILETSSPDQAELVVSGIISIFHKLYGKFWGPRMQYILRNALLTLVDVPGSTLPDVVKILSDRDWRSGLYAKITNKALLSFWEKEFDTLDDETRLQYTYPILNKIGQFVNSPLIQNIISQAKSSVNLAEIMNSGKIFLANLSQGKLGEDNATLLGAMLITKFELASLERIDTPAKERANFFLYVDEFQNFATQSFIKILSEARKFHLGLVLANQYVAQIPEDIQAAIFGNAGTMISFVLGADDAKIVSKEFSPVFDENSLVNLQLYQIVLKMTIDGTLSRPFSAYTLPPLKSTNQSKLKVIAESQRRWGTK